MTVLDLPTAERRTARLSRRHGEERWRSNVPTSGFSIANDLAPGAHWPLAGRGTELAALAAAIASPNCSMVVLYGPAGVGKTTLADAALAQAVATGRPTARVLASAAAALLPLGALAPVLPPDIDAISTPRGVFNAALGALQALGDGATPMLFVDDAHLLDASSAVLVTQLVAADAVVVVATIRDGESLPDVVAGWWRTRNVVRLDVGDLTRAAVADVLTTALGGPVGADTVFTLHTASGGNPLVLRELVHLAIAEHQLRSDTGTWRLLGVIPPSRRLADLLDARLALIDGASRFVLDQLALCAPLGASELTGDVTAAQIETLERIGLVRVVTDDLRQQLVLGHPLYGEVLRAELLTTRRNAILLAVADRVTTLGARRREDARRVATWRLDGGGAPDPALLIQAARIARLANDFAGVERLATVLRRIEPSVESTILLGEALSELGKFEESETVFAEPLPDGTSDVHVARHTTVRAKNLQWGLCDWESALSVVQTARAHIGPEFIDDLLAEEAAALSFSGRPQQALDLLARITSTSPNIAVQVAIDRSVALSMIGRPNDAIEVADVAFAAHLDLADPMGLAHPGTHIVNRAFALIEAGRLHEAIEVSVAGYDIAVTGRIPMAQIWFANMLGKIEMLRGRLIDSRGWYREGASTARLHMFRGPLRLAIAGEAAADAMLGNGEAAADLIMELEALPEFLFLAHDQTIGSAWSLWANRSAGAARGALIAQATLAAATFNRSSAAWLLHDAARLGAIGTAVALGILAAESDSALITVRATHAAALDAADPHALGDVSRQLEGIGMDLVAAEAASSAADAFRRALDQRSAAHEARRSRELAARCQGAVTPGLAVIDSIVPLSAREREIALIASQGVASQEIADQLYLSIRTVNNHLQRVYTKLGVTGRAQLAEALATD